MKTVVYKLPFTHLGIDSNITEDDSYRFVFWKPSLKSFIPPQKSKKYFLFWLFHFLRIFRNKNYTTLLVYDDQVLVNSVMILPASFKWPFMQTNDLQFMYLITHQDYRGKGIAEKGIRYALGKLSEQGRDFWWVTDTNNTASIKLCSKVGFHFFGYAKWMGKLKILRMTDV
jgi:ribosomal protein S18 acetylase RimI-like enzyme